ncbi:MAG: hypothetical protein Q7S92_02380 [Candidatus Diapherotrites archaeon]|nr:hypothetical protein [Candidatus Diapherotrites archaeon]
MNHLTKLIFGIAIFLASASLASAWLGLIWRNSVFIFVISFGFTLLVLSKIKLPENPSKNAFLFAILTLILAGHPFLIIHPFYDASADPAASIVSLTIQEKIPATYAPYSNLPFTYELGFPLIAKIFIDFIPTIPAYGITWFLGLVFAFLQAIFVYFIGKKMFDSEKAGLIGIALFSVSKIVYQNMYWGQFPFMMATVFFLSFVFFFFEQHWLAGLFFPAIFLAHPGPAAYTILFIVLAAIFFKHTRAGILKVIPASLFALPAFFISYKPLIENTLSSAALTSNTANIPAYLAAIPPWVGLSFLTAVLTCVWVVKTKKYSQEILFWITCFISSLLLFVILGLINSGSTSLLAGRLIEFVFFSAVFVTLSVFIHIPKLQTQFFKPLVLLILFLGLILFFTSTTLTHLRNGPRITPEEAEFAFAFKTFDPYLEKALILSQSNAKIAELANKIPYNIKSKWYLPYGVHQNQSSLAYEQINEEEETWKKIVEEQCIECINTISVRYIAVNTDFIDLNMPYPLVFEFKKFKVYQKE